MRDIDLALEEIKRVLVQGGKIVTATWAKDHMREFDELSASALHSVFGETRHYDVVARFDLQSAPGLIGRHFANVTTTEWRGWLEPPDVGTLVRFWELQHVPGFPDALAPVRDEFRRLAEKRLDANGRIRITRHGAVFVGYKE